MPIPEYTRTAQLGTLVYPNTADADADAVSEDEEEVENANVEDNAIADEAVWVGRKAEEYAEEAVAVGGKQIQEGTTQVVGCPEGRMEGPPHGMHASTWTDELMDRLVSAEVAHY